MAVFLWLHLLCLGLEGDHQAHTVDVVILALDAAEEEEDTMIGGPSMIGDPVEAYHQANGGGVRHHRSESQATAEEEEAAAVVVDLDQDQMVTGMDVEGDDGDLLQVSESYECRLLVDRKLVMCSSN